MPLKVYCLDDEPALLEILVDMFASEEVQMMTFTDPRAAIEAIRLDPPDLLFVDYRLPNTTGLLVAKQLNATFPIYLVTGEINMPHDPVFRGILHKPMKMEAIEALIKSAQQLKKAS